jgi:hypothetical protein
MSYTLHGPLFLSSSLHAAPALSHLINPYIFFYSQLVVEGGAAGRGPKSPEPPSMSLDGSSHVSSMMVEELETGAFT